MATLTSQRVGVYGCILNREHRLLIIKRASFDTSPGLWEMPGGALELGEALHNGVIREVKEETGLDVTPLYPITALSGTSKRDPSQQIIRIAYLCFINTASQKVQISVEHSDYKWIDTQEAGYMPLSDLLEETLTILEKYPSISNSAATDAQEKK